MITHYANETISSQRATVKVGTKLTALLPYHKKMIAHILNADLCQSKPMLVEKEERGLVLLFI